MARERRVMAIKTHVQVGEEGISNFLFTHPSERCSNQGGKPS
jgi:hypothetical protein